MATTPKRHKSLNSIRKHSLHTRSTEIQKPPNHNTTIPDKQSTLIQIPATNIKTNTTDNVDKRSTTSTDIISNDKYRRHNTSINTRKRQLKST